MEHQSVIRLCRNVPLSPDYGDTLVFASVSAQQTYFEGKVAYNFTELTYIKEMPVIIPNQAGNYRNCNYLMFTNPDLPTKWFYAFITSVEYIADGTTRINYEIDLFQTWFFEMSVKQCFVIRQHVNDDIAGNYIKDEGLATGPYVTQEIYQKFFVNWWLVVVSSVLFSDQEFPPSEGYVYSGVYSGLAYYCYSLTDINRLGVLLEALAGEGKSDAIVSMYMVPHDVLVDGQVSGKPMQSGTATANPFIAPNTQLLDGYTPRNKKLLTYPYRSLRATNKVGNSVNMRYELFDNDNFNFSIAGSPFPNGRILMYPDYYDGTQQNLEYAINLGDYPQCSWVKDVYSNWLATQNIKWGYEEQQREQHFVGNLASNTLGGIAGAVTQDYKTLGESIGGMINSLFSSYIAEQDAREKMSAEKQIHSMTPPAAKGTIGNEDTLMVRNRYGFALIETTITAEYAKSIDGYFDLYGYRVDKVTTPNIFGRSSWNYVKTSGAIVVGTAPTVAIEFYKKLLDRGVRFWHGDYIGDYSRSNSPTGS